MPYPLASIGTALVSSLERAADEMKNGQPEGEKMSETMAYIREERVIEEQKLWRAVIANTVEDWIYGPLHRQREAEHFLFEDDDDFHIVCFSAGMDPRYFRDRLKKIRGGEGAEALARAS
jgi:hypothetical protein